MISISFSKCFQKNSGKRFGCTGGLTKDATSPSKLSSFEHVQINAECIKARMIQTASGDKSLSGDGIEVLSAGFPRSCPLLVASLLYEYKIIYLILAPKFCNYNIMLTFLQAGYQFSNYGFFLQFLSHKYCRYILA